MKFNDDKKSPIPITVLKSLFDIPKPHAEQWQRLTTKIGEQLLAFTDAPPSKGLPDLPDELYKGMDERLADALDDLVRFMAFQELQIHGLQTEMRVVYEGMDQFSKLLGPYVADDDDAPSRN